MFDTARHSQLVDEVFALAPVIPVLAIDRIEDALPLCRALVDNGLPVLEITLRTARRDVAAADRAEDAADSLLRDDIAPPLRRH